jgi:DNA-binding XRE family transcriptional regulator
VSDTVITVENLSKSYLVGHKSGPQARSRYTALRAGDDPSGVHEEDPKDATARNRARTPTCGGGDMRRKMAPVEESVAAWRRNPDYETAYNALEDEFSLATAMIEARAHAGLTQEQLAERMYTTQAVIARLESGRVKPRHARSNGSPRRQGCGYIFHSSRRPRTKRRAAAPRLYGPVALPDQLVRAAARAGVEYCVFGRRRRLLGCKL